VKASLPTDAPRDLKAYRVTGTATLSRLTLAGVAMEQVNARVRYADGVLDLEELRGAFAEGSFEGTARLGVIPEGDLSAHLTLNAVPLGQVLKAVPRMPDQVSGTVSGRADLRVPAGHLQDVTAWHGSGRLTAPAVNAFGLTLKDASAAARVERGTLRVSDVQCTLEGAPVGGAGDLGLTAPYRFNGKLELAKGDLASLERLAPEFRPPVAVAGRFGVTAEAQGTLSPMAVKTTGTGTGEDLKVERLRVGRLNFHWAMTGGRLRLSDVQARLYGGKMTGSAEVPLRADEAGSINMAFADVDLGDLMRDVPAVPVKLAGKAGGKVEGKLTAAAGGRPRDFDANIDLSAPRLRVQSFEADRLTGTVSYRNGAGAYHLKGHLFGGTFDLDGRFPPRPASGTAPAPSSLRPLFGGEGLGVRGQAPPPPEGRLRLEGAQLGLVWPTLGLGQTLGPLQGRLDVQLDFRHEGPFRLPVGTGSIVVSRLRWDMTELAPRLRADVALAGFEVRLRNLSGTVANGDLRGQALLNLLAFDRSWFNLGLDQADLARLLAPWPSLASSVQGAIDARLRGTLGREWSGGGTVVLSRGKVAGVDVSEWRLPLTFAFAPSQARGQVDVPETSAQVGRGRLTGRGSFGFGAGTHLEGGLRFYGVDLRALVPPSSGLSQVGSGQASGRIDFGGHDVRSLNDVTATVDASFSQAQAFQMPILAQLAPMIAPGQSSATFQSGDLRGRLAGGLFRIERLGLTGRTLTLFADGTVTTEGRLNLQVTAMTGRIGVSPSLLRLFGLRIPAVGPIPVGLILQVTDLLSRNTIHLRVGGTVRSPTIQVEALPLLTEAAVRFFLNQANVPIP
jgi:hypothetical protein